MLSSLRKGVIGFFFFLEGGLGLLIYVKFQFDVLVA